MHRLFVAIRPPAEIRHLLLSTMEGASGVNWQDDGQLHLTLRFIGEVDGPTLDDIVAALGSIQSSRLELAVSGVGTFESKGRIHTLWAGVTPRDPLAALHKKIDRAMIAIGLQPESRSYKPHITLARMGGRTADLGGFLAQHAALSTAAFAADWFALYESTVGKDGGVYEEIARYPLGEKGKSAR